MVMVARGLPSRASKKAWQNDDKREAGAVFSRPEGGGKHKKRFKAMGGVKGRVGRPKRAPWWAAKGGLAATRAWGALRRD